MDEGKGFGCVQELRKNTVINNDCPFDQTKETDQAESKLERGFYAIQVRPDVAVTHLRR